MVTPAAKQIDTSVDELQGAMSVTRIKKKHK